MKTRITGPTVGELMSIEPVTVADTETVGAAERLMTDRSITGLPVVARVGRLVGVLSQTDLVRAHASGQSLENWPGLAVRHLMTAPALTIRLDETLLPAPRMMGQHHVHRLGGGAPPAAPPLRGGSPTPPG